MESFLDKVSSYNILNFFLPGAVFLYLSPYFIAQDIIPDEIFAQLIFSYFLGMLTSRIGSLFLEDFLKLIGVLKPSEYLEYVAACRNDKNISVILETCNMYRTFVAGGLVALISGMLGSKFELFSLQFWLIVGILFLLLFSYIKQYRFVTKRVIANRGG